MVDPRDYDRLRYLQMNGGQPNSFEETINRVSVSDILPDPRYNVTFVGIQRCSRNCIRENRFG